MKILPVPELRQTYDYDCGAKAVQAILAYYGIDTSENEVMKSAGTNKSGTTVKGILKSLKKYGLKYDEGRMTIEKIKKYIDRKIPVILVLQAWTDKKKVKWERDWADGHYVVAIGYDRNKLYFEDPSSVLRTYLTFKELEKRWHDRDKFHKKYIKYVNYGIAVYGKKPSFDLNKIIHMD